MINTVKHGKKDFLLWLAAMVLQSILECNILRLKVKFEIYFPNWKVVSKVSVKALDPIKFVDLQ